MSSTASSDRCFCLREHSDALVREMIIHSSTIKLTAKLISTNHHSMDISVPALYRRFVVEGKGSYCFGHNTLFLQMIRALGYR